MFAISLAEDVHDRLVHLKPVLDEGLTRLHDVHDNVGQTRIGAISIEPDSLMISHSLPMEA